MKTKEELNYMVREMVKALCNGGFGRLQAMLGAEPVSITDNTFTFSFKMFSKANLFKIELDEGLICITAISLRNANIPPTI